MLLGAPHRAYVARNLPSLLIDPRTEDLGPQLQQDSSRFARAPDADTGMGTQVSWTQFASVLSNVRRLDGLDELSLQDARLFLRSVLLPRASAFGRAFLLRQSPPLQMPRRRT